MDDQHAYEAYKHHRQWFDKLWFSESIGYHCGPSGIPPNRNGFYVVRPVMNLSGMSIGARKQFIYENDNTQVEPGYFWCEWFEGIQYSVTYTKETNRWIQQSCFRAERDTNQLYKFKKWSRYGHTIFGLPEQFDQLLDLETINVEFIDKKPIEVHLRKSPDPDCDEFIPIWAGEEHLVDKYTKMGYSYTESYDNANGFLVQPRLGFMVK